MKILQIIDSLAVGGAERVMVDIANILDDNNYKNTVLAISASGAMRDKLNDEVEVIFLEMTSKFQIEKWFRLYKIISQYDVLHVHMRHNLKVVALTKAIFGFRQKIIFHDHFGKIKVDKSASWFLKKVIQGADQYVGVSSELSDWAREVCELPGDKIHTMTNIVRRQNVKIASNHSKAPFRLVLVANFHYIKNIEFAIHLVEYLNQNGHYTLDVYGQKNDEDYYNRLETLIEEKGLRDKIRLITNCSNVQPELHQYDLGIHTSKSETGPLVLMEFISQNLPFLCFETGQVVQQLKPHLPEFILQDFDLKSWEKNIQQILKRNREGQLPGLQTIFSKLYSEQKYMAQCLEIYQKSLN